MTGKELVLCEYSRLFLGSSKQSQKGSTCLEEAREGTLARRMGAVAFPAWKWGLCPLLEAKGWMYSTKQRLIPVGQDT